MAWVGAPKEERLRELRGHGAERLDLREQAQHLPSKRTWWARPLTKRRYWSAHQELNELVSEGAGVVAQLAWIGAREQ